MLKAFASTRLLAAQCDHAARRLGVIGFRRLRSRRAGLRDDCFSMSWPRASRYRFGDI